MENFVYGDTPDKSAIDFVITQIYSSPDQWEVLHHQLSRESNIRQLPLKTLLVYLELHQVIQSQYSYFADYRFKFIQTEEAITNRFQGERRSFVEAIFHCSKKARTWSTLDFDALWMTYQADRRRVVTAIDYFHEQGWIELESKQITDVYQVLNTQIPKDDLVDSMYELFSQKEHNEINRIKAMVSFFQSDACLSYSLASYFADSEAPQKCGHCSVCSGVVAKLPEPDFSPIDAEALRIWIQPFVDSSPKPLSIEALSRFLCGIATPLSTRLKASKMEGYGKLEAYPFAEVKTALETLGR